MPEYTYDNPLYRANLENLTSLWQRMGVENASGIAAGLRRSQSWPNRAWFEPGLEVEPGSELQRAIEGQRPGTIFPVWRYDPEHPDHWHNALLAAGLTLQSELTAMCLTGYRLSLLEESGLVVREVSRGWEIDAWSELCGRCFGYQIDSAVIRRIAPDERVQVLWALVNDVPVATALLYNSNTAVGVHQVGVDPAWRGRGLAQQFMRSVTNRAILHWQPAALVLQASRDGLEIYRRQGFVEQFRIGLYG
jgi:GNAT superfamily N-acetyltransferase